MKLKISIALNVALLGVATFLFGQNVYLRLERIIGDFYFPRKNPDFGANVPRALVPAFDSKGISTEPLQIDFHLERPKAAPPAAH